jgi:putative DNA primase/helicase
VWQALAKIYGDYATVLNQRGLEDKFNSDWVDSKLFVLAEEVVTRAEMWHIKNELKELVTGDWVRVNPKNVAAYRQRNQINFVFLSNEGQPIPLENDDRRHLVIWTPPAMPEEAYDAVQAEIHSGGIAALYHHLLQVDLEGWHPSKRPPMTQAKRELIQVSAASEARFVDDWQNRELGLPLVPCRSSDLYAEYLRWCRLNGETRPRASNQFFNAIHRRPGWEKAKARIYDGAKTVPANLILPPDELLQIAGTAQRPEESRPQYLTDCCEKFVEQVRARQKREAAWAE